MLPDKSTSTQYPTGDFYRAAYFISHGIELIDIKPVTTERCLFVFELTEELRQKLREYDAHEAVVPVHAYVTALKILKSDMYRVVSPCRP